MSKRASWAVIGYGNIGRELCRQLAQPVVARRTGLRAKPEFVLRSRDNMAAVEELPAVVFIAIPSTDDGQPAYDYISRLLKAGRVVVTAEKGALANYYDELHKASNGFARLGVEAAVGGGTRMVSELAGYCQDPANISRLDLVLNGTLTAIFSSLSAGASLDKAVKEAIKAGYAEPGQKNPQAIIHSEAEGDIPKKTAILFNRLGLSDKVLDWQKLKFQFKDNELSKLLKGAKKRRFIVSISPNNIRGEVIGGFRVSHDGWQIIGGFREVELDSPLRNLKNADNGFVIGLGPDETDGVYSLTGPGAGVRPTVNAMLDDYLAMLIRK